MCYHKAMFSNKEVPATEYCLILLCAVWLALLIAERIRARRDRARLEHVIHVNGTRGKSTVTRLIAAGLRAGGWRTACKTTGTDPIYSGVDGSERLIRRIAPSNIREQLRILHRAAGESAQILVAECMAVQPELQRVAQQEMLLADIGVITNVRLDHTDVMGGTLSVSGFLLQTFFRNPIAGPYVLGVSSGAKFTVCIAMVLFFTGGRATSSATLILAAFAGAMISMGFVLVISQKVHQMSMLVVCGVMIGYICSALTDFLVTFADDSSIVNLHNWSLGSFSGMSWDNVKTMAVVCGITLLLTFLLSKPIRAYQLGEVYAQNMGVPLRAFRTALILLSSVLSACVTAFAGPISFVGIAVPHLMKSLFKSAEPLCMIPACFLGGGVFCLFCDLIARTAFAPTEVSISSVTAVFGAPIVIYMMIHRKAA